MNPLPAESAPRRRGRPADVDPERVALLALRHFAADGYEATTMDDIAAIAGVGRRTLFRYFPSKPDLVWGGIEPVVERIVGGHDDVTLRKVNVAEDAAMADSMGVRGLPTLVFTAADGRELHRMSGSMTGARIEDGLSRARAGL